MPRALSAALLFATTLAFPLAGWAADPVRIGVTAPETGPYPDRPLAEHQGIETALGVVNQAGGVLGTRLDAVFVDNGCKPPRGPASVDELVRQDHVPVMIGALCTPVTKTAMPEVAELKVPLVIEITAGQNFVDESGAGGNRYAFKINPSEVDLARGFIGYWKRHGAQRVALLADPGAFAQANAAAMRAEANTAGLAVALDETIPAQGFDAQALVARLRAARVDHLIIGMMGKSIADLYRAMEAAGWSVPVGGRFDLGAATGAVSPAFAATRGQDVTIAGYSALLATRENQNFVAAYRAVSGGRAPDQRAYYGFEATRLIADAIRRARRAEPEAIRKALAGSRMKSLLGGDYRMDAHNHAHPGALLLGLRNGKPAVVARIPS